MSLLGNLCSCLRPQDQCVCANGVDADSRDAADDFRLDDTPLACPIGKVDGETCESCQ